MACRVDKAIAFNCDAPQQGGVKARLIVLNYEDWIGSTVTIDGTSKEIATITLPLGAVMGYEFKVPTSANLVLTQELRGDRTYKHIVQAQVQTIEQLDVDMIARLRTQKVVVIAELIEGRARVYGGHIKTPDTAPTPIGVGLLLSQDNDIITDVALGGLTDFILNTPDDQPGEAQKPRLIESTFDIDDLLVASDPIPAE